METTSRYLGDLTPTGETVHFRAAAPDGLHPDAKKKLTDADLEIVDDPATAQALIIRSKTKLLLPEAFATRPDLMYVARAGVGVDNIDMRQASEAGVATINTPGESTRPVAQRVLAFILAWSARIREGTEALRDGTWPKGDKNVEPIDLTEKTLGIIGYGRIGEETARIAGPLFGKTVYTDKRNIPGAIPLEELLRQSDVVSMNVSGKDPVLTRDLLKKFLRDNALVVNTARATVIDLDALLEQMNSRGVSAALDVYPNEGKPEMFRRASADASEETTTAKIAKHPHFLGTPHTAASDQVTQKRLGFEAADRIVEFAHFGTINPGNLPGHTLPAITLEKPKADGNGNGNHTPPRSRVVTLHRSVKGASRRLDGIMAEHDVNIAQSTNAEGPHKLAMTLQDIDEVRTEVLIQILGALNEDPDVIKRRIMMFSA
ncbi:MAG: NAD(P)-dependent oxidoreductase [Candidatus Peribacteraceae bacterium]|nr:NAD(P)-dependent oxidoreductase [Candidatus Peribacteraceae bacterium]MDD5742580.1 NAD(P)-dependent oxidoreductase [Candidatus Peribacteraceae bacterium]